MYLCSGYCDVTGSPSFETLWSTKLPDRPPPIKVSSHPPRITPFRMPPFSASSPRSQHSPIMTTTLPSTSSTPASTSVESWCPSSGRKFTSCTPRTVSWHGRPLRKHAADGRAMESSTIIPCTESAGTSGEYSSTSQRPSSCATVTAASLRPQAPATRSATTNMNARDAFSARREWSDRASRNTPSKLLRVRARIRLSVCSMVFVLACEELTIRMGWPSSQ